MESPQPPGPPVSESWTRHGVGPVRGPGLWMVGRQARSAAQLAVLMLIGVILLFSTDAPDQSPLIFTSAAFLLSFAVLLGLSQIFRDSNFVFSTDFSSPEPGAGEQQSSPGRDLTAAKWRKRSDFATVIFTAAGGGLFVLSLLLAVFERVEW